MKIVIANIRYFVSGGPERYMFNIKEVPDICNHYFQIEQFLILIYGEHYLIEINKSYNLRTSHTSYYKLIIFRYLIKLSINQ